MVFDHLYLVATATQPVIQKLSKSIMKRVKKPNLVVRAFGIIMLIMAVIDVLRALSTAFRYVANPTSGGTPIYREGGVVV